MMILLLFLNPLPFAPQLTLDVKDMLIALQKGFTPFNKSTLQTSEMLPRIGKILIVESSHGHVKLILKILPYNAR